MKGISGFPEWLPQEQRIVDHILGVIREIFELYGFGSVETPAVEKVDTLLSKGDDHEIYGLYRLADPQGGRQRDLALRFDLTVPLARYVAQYGGELCFPYKRYHIGPVWRGERPQAGRYRQFTQCDIDIVGQEELPLAYDGEVIAVMQQVFSALHLNDFILRLNNRKIFFGLMASFGLENMKAGEVLRILDKVGKLSLADILQLLQLQALPKTLLQILMDMASGARSSDLQELRSLCDHREFQQGITELEEVMDVADEFGAAQNMTVDLSLVRGLSYYTGTLYEGTLKSHPSLGSVCGGGRYGNLVERLAASQKSFPGVGASLGISRLLSILMQKEVFRGLRLTPAWVLVTCQDRQSRSAYLKLSRLLRDGGIATEIYLDQKSLKAQMKYADKKGFPFVVVANTQELEGEVVVLRDLRQKSQQRVNWNELVEVIEKKIAEQ